MGGGDLPVTPLCTRIYTLHSGSDIYTQTSKQSSLIPNNNLSAVGYPFSNLLTKCFPFARHFSADFLTHPSTNGRAGIRFDYEAGTNQRSGWRQTCRRTGPTLSQLVDVSRYLVLSQWQASCTVIQATHRTA